MLPPLRRPLSYSSQVSSFRRVHYNCDYYLLIIGGRYGSTTSEGMSYTEKEYDYAVSKGLKVIALIHENPDEIPLGKSERDPLLQERLKQFREKVSTGRLVRFWKSAEDLPGLVALSMTKAIKLFPAIGWVRANRPPSEAVLAEINELRKQNVALKSALIELQPPQLTITDLADLDEELVMVGKYYNKTYRDKRHWRATFKWKEIFASLAPYLVQIPSDGFVKSILTTAAFARSGTDHTDSRDPDLNDQQFRTIAVQLQAHGLVKVEYTQATNGTMALFWSLTPQGHRLMMELRTVKKPSERAGNQK
jgi:hypothetical protein